MVNWLSSYSKNNFYHFVYQFVIHIKLSECWIFEHYFIEVYQVLDKYDIYSYIILYLTFIYILKSILYD